MSISGMLAFWKCTHVFFAFGNPLALIITQKESYGSLAFFLTDGPPFAVLRNEAVQKWEEGMPNAQNISMEQISSLQGVTGQP